MGWSKDCGREHLLSPEALADTWVRVYRRLKFNLVTACWEFPGAHTKRGYGIVGTASLLFGTHRIAWVAHNGLIPPGILVLHSCDNPKCCNPAHLFLGDHDKNTADAKAKGRLKAGPIIRGEDHKSTKLSDEAVREIRARRLAGEGQRALGRQFGVSKTQIRRIERGESRVGP